MGIGQEIFEEIIDPEQELTPTGFHLSFNRPKEGVLELDRNAAILVKLFEEAQKNDKISNFFGVRSADYGVANAKKINTISNLCHSKPTCIAESKFRTMDGSCNNLKKTNNGRAKTPFQRILESDYGGK